MKELFVMHDLVGKSLSNASLAKKEVTFIRVVIELGIHVMIVIPVFTFIALDHKLVHISDSMRLFTVTITIEEILCVVISVVFVVIFIIIETA